MDQPAFLMRVADQVLLFVVTETRFEFLGAGEAGSDLDADEEGEDEPHDWWRADGLGISVWEQ
jgi:hypothetical protein